MADQALVLRSIDDPSPASPPPVPSPAADEAGGRPAPPRPTASAPAAPDPAPLGSRLARGWPGLAVAVPIAAWLSWPEPTPAAPRPIPCARAGLVDGQLRCDAELPTDPAAACPDSRGPASHDPVVAGDALDTARLCERAFASPEQPGHGWARMEPEELAMLGQPVDINAASLAELESLPRVGPKLAQRIVEGRPYADVAALERVRGIGPATLERLRDRAIVNQRARAAPASRWP